MKKHAGIEVVKTWSLVRLHSIKHLINVQVIHRGMMVMYRSFTVGGWRYEAGVYLLDKGG